MTSGNLLFKLMKEDCKGRIWAIALTALGSIFCYPVMAALLANNMNNYLSYEKALKIYTQNVTALLDFGGGATVMWMLAAALICGMSSFAYLNSKSKVDFYHSIPVRREKIYLANYINGVLFQVIPYVVSMGLAVMIAAGNGVAVGLLIPLVVRSCVLNLIYFLLIYSTVVIAGMLTGNIVVEFFGAMVFLFYMPVFFSVLQGCYSTFFRTFYSAGSEQQFFENGSRISPIMEYIYQIERYGEGGSVIGAAMIALVISVVLAVLGALLYQRRPSEAAGKAMAFRVSRPIVRIPICLLSGLAVGLLFWTMQNSAGWMIFGAVCGVVISHCVMEIIYHFDFKKLFSHKIQMVGCAVVSIVVLSVFQTDRLGYDTWLPEESQIKETAIQISLLNDWVSYGSITYTEEQGYYWESTYYYNTPGVLEPGRMSCGKIPEVLSIAASGIRQTMERKQEKTYYDADEETEETAAAATAVIGGADGPTSIFLAGKESEEDPVQEWGGTGNVTVRYGLTNGRQVYRTYYMSLADVIADVDAVYQDPGYLAATFPVMERTADEMGIVRYREAEGEAEFDLPDLTEAEKEELLTTWQREYAELTMEKMADDVPIGLIQFSTKEYEAALEWLAQPENKRYGYREDLSYRDYYPVYACFTDTIALLEKHGITPGGYWNHLKLNSVIVYDYDSNYEYGVKSVEIRDPKQLEQLRGILKDMNRKYYDGMYTPDPIDATVRYEKEDGTEGYRGMCFPKGQVPEFVKQALAEAETEG
ncbi:MAG: ABC transporter permease [Clostridiales bacterium]|nr:ABC transporter permease [Clostridiales bacterium]